MKSSTDYEKAAQAFMQTKKQRQYCRENLIRLIEMFHGHASPGVVMGVHMVQLAQDKLEDGVLYNAVCETVKCLPDAIQLFTPCTIGNGWLSVIDLGKFALSLFNKHTGRGVRVSVSVRKLENWPEIRNWFLKLKPKKEQDRTLLHRQIVEAGAEVLDLDPVELLADYYGAKKRDKIALCPLCDEAYPSKHGASCLACQNSAGTRIYQSM